jgi:hypothetical protein
MFGRNRGIQITITVVSVFSKNVGSMVDQSMYCLPAIMGVSAVTSVVSGSKERSISRAVFREQSASGGVLPRSR